MGIQFKNWERFKGKLQQRSTNLGPERVAIEFGYLAPYAIWVHEMYGATEYKMPTTPGTKPQYLREPLRTLGPTAVDVSVSVVAKGGNLVDAMVKGARLIFDASNQIAPKEYGTLRGDVIFAIQVEA